MRKLKKFVALLMAIISCALLMSGCDKGSSGSMNGPINQTKLYINKSQLTVIVSESAKITATVEDNSPITFESLDQTVCTVDQTGLVLGVDVGTAVIVVTANGEKQYCTVNVVGDGYSIEFNHPEKICVVEGTTVSLYANVKKNGKSFETIAKWNTSGQCATTVINENTINVTTTTTGTFIVSATVGQCEESCQIKVYSKTATQLDTPSLKIEESNVNWSAIENADAYLVKIGCGEWVNTTQLNVDISNVDSGTTIFVQAISNEFSFFDSDVQAIVI